MFWGRSMFKNIWSWVYVNTSSFVVHLTVCYCITYRQLNIINSTCSLLLWRLFDLIRTSDAVLWKGPSNSYDLQPSQHFFVSHVMLGVTQLKFGVPVANASNVNWVVIGKINTKPSKTSQSIWYLPREATCLKMSSNSNERFSSFDVSFSVSFSAIIP